MEAIYKEIKFLTFASDLNNLAQVEKEIDNLCRDYHINEDHYGNILIAVTEAVNNAISHGNASDRSKNFTLSVLKHQNEFKIVVSDEGNGFDYLNLPDPTAPENLEKESGRGVFLIKALSDAVEFEKNGAVISMKFIIPND